MQVVGDFIFINLLLLVLSQGQAFWAQEGIFEWNQSIFPPQRKDNSLIKYHLSKLSVA